MKAKAALEKGRVQGRGVGPCARSRTENGQRVLKGFTVDERARGDTTARGAREASPVSRRAPGVRRQ